MIALSMSKCGEFCRNPTLVFATPALQHFHAGLQLISLGHDAWFLRWLLQTNAFHLREFQSFCFDDARQNKKKQSRPITIITALEPVIAPPFDLQTKSDQASRR